ncbi:MAG: deoxyribose-phosphate aldolase [Xanthomonadaceae bacterium]|nr:deoxyribose-phosphate aldolase [Xanthomonadaceae bacterium]
MKSINEIIDHTLLKPEATPAQIEQICREAKTHHFATVCVNPIYVKIASESLKGSNVLPITVVGFPLGATTTDQKVSETLSAIKDGALEIDMVISLGKLKSEDDFYVETDIRRVVEAADKIPVKVIIESAMLSDNEIVRACLCARRAGAAFVKTSTGFGPGGAKPEHVSLMRKTVGPDIGVKASGGIKTLEDAMKMIEAGANRIGTSSSISISEAYEKSN